MKVTADHLKQFARLSHHQEMPFNHKFITWVCLLMEKNSQNHKITNSTTWQNESNCRSFETICSLSHHQDMPFNHKFITWVCLLVEKNSQNHKMINCTTWQNESNCRSFETICSSFTTSGDAIQSQIHHLSLSPHGENSTTTTVRITE